MFKFIIFLFGFIIVLNLQAIPINTSVALPVATGNAVFRLQSKFFKSDSDRHLFVAAVAYGLSRRTTLIVSSLGVSKGPTKGMGDSSILVRQTVLQFDAPLYTSRLGLLGGVKLPTGVDEVTTNSTDWRAGGVYTMQSDQHEFDSSVIFHVNTTGSGIKMGDRILHDLAYQIRISPWHLPETGVPSQWNLVVELNGIFSEKNRVSGATDPNTGGYQLFLSPGVQWVSQKIILEFLFQKPVVQNLNGSQMQEEYRLLSGTRFQF